MMAQAHPPSRSLAGTRILNLMLAAGRGGVETMARRYHDALSGAGAKVMSIGRPKGWFASTFADPGAFAPVMSLAHADPIAPVFFRRTLRRFGADLVIAHGKRAFTVAAAGSAQSSAPLVMVAHNAWFGESASKADLVIAVSRSVADEVRARMPSTPCVVVENFGPLAAGPLKPLSASPAIAALGRLDVDKGFDVLIQAVAILRDRGRSLRLRLAGEGPERKALEVLVRDLALAGEIEFLPWVQAPGRFIGEADLFVCSSRVEPFGLVVVEAMAAGSPIVATDVGGPREILEHGRLGRLARPGDPADLAAAIAAALDDWPASLERAREAQATALARYSFEAGAARLTAALEPLLLGARRA